MRPRGAKAGFLGLCCALLLASPAPAAEVIGQNGPAHLCAFKRAYVQEGLVSGTSYSPSEYGVITSWSSVAEVTPNRPLKLLVMRPNPFGGPHHFITTQKDELRTLAVPSQLNTFTGMHIPIEPDERLGLYSPDGQPAANGLGCFITGNAGDTMRVRLGEEPPLGVSLDFPDIELTNTLRLNVSAVVEPDADRDTFGDETQDQCPTDASVQGACADTTITKGPKDKVKTAKKKAKASFEFTSNVPDASFQCAVDDQALKVPCTSPYTVKVKKGTHAFQVRAVSPGGVPDATPATDDWKVKRKKK